MDLNSYNPDKSVIWEAQWKLAGWSKVAVTVINYMYFQRIMSLHLRCLLRDLRKERKRWLAFTDCLPFEDTRQYMLVNIFTTLNIYGPMTPLY